MDEYVRFSDNLNVHELTHLKAKLESLYAEGKIEAGKLVRVPFERPMGHRSFEIYVYLQDDPKTIWLLGGHWIRKGEPAAEFMRQMREHVKEIGGEKRT
jgi:hypothetical protein